jgi:hypothetical protein
MAKFKLNPNPTFKRKVGLTDHDGSVVELELEFRHRSRAAVQTLPSEIKDKTDAEILLLLAAGWELSDEFNLANATVLCDNYLSAAEEILTGYLAALQGARLGN